MKESEKVEFKRTWNDDILKTLCAFANTEGGTIYIGVDDKGKPTGLFEIEKLLVDLPNKIRDKLGIIPSIDLAYHRGKEFIKIEVIKSDVPISYEGRFYIRSGSTVQEIKGNELIRFILKRQNLTWDCLPSDADINEVDIETIEKFKKLAKKRLPEISEEDSIEKLLRNLELLVDRKLTNAGVLLFTKKPQKYIINAGARVGRFKTPSQIIDTVDAYGNIFKQLEILLDGIKKHLNVRFEIKDIEREDIWDYPIPALREAVINALIHRDYLETADIQIKVYDDRIWFWNPGKLPPEISIDMLKREHSSIPRNRLIATAFYFAGLVEKWGSGTKRMVDLCREQGLPEPEFKEEMGGFSVYFYKDIYTEDNLRKMGLNERQVKAIIYLKERGRITNKEYRDLTGISDEGARIDLKILVEKGLIKIVGKGRGVYYLLE